MRGLLIQMLLPIITGVVSEMLTKDNFQKYGDNLFDMIEDAVAASSTTIDDAIVLPIVKQIREVLQIPDNDE